MNPFDSISSTAIRPGRIAGPEADPFGQLGPVEGAQDRQAGPASTIEPGRIAATPAPIRPHVNPGREATGTSFADTLSAAANGNDVHLSSHALRRIEQRGIDLGQPEFVRLNGAFAQLAGKGGRQSLVLVDQVAYVVHVPSKTVVTAVAPDERNDSNVFTRIDSVVIA
jgi:flagellar operon protein